MNFSEYGQEIIVLIPMIHPTKVQAVKLLGVEAGGIWIESQDLTSTILRASGKSSANKVIGFFFPFAQITFAMASLEGVSLNEAAFGL